MTRQIVKACFLSVFMGYFALLSACTGEPSDEAMERVMDKAAEKGRQSGNDQQNKEIERNNVVRGALR